MMFIFVCILMYLLGVEMLFLNVSLLSGVMGMFMKKLMLLIRLCLVSCVLVLYV